MDFEPESDPLPNEAHALSPSVSGLKRRDFLKLTGLGGVGWAVSPMPLMAGPFDEEDWAQYIPSDKKLHPDWVKSLFERGTPTTYEKSRNELRFIGMPVGGLCCGTLYLGGDGRLWNWDIFNQKTEGVLPRRVRWADVGMDFATGDSSIRPRDGATYVKPAVQGDSQAIAQGFALRVKSDGHTQTRALETAGWAEVRFTGQYPIATVGYSDPDCPVAVKLEAFSPFVPHRFEDSSLPATVFHFTLTHTGAETAVVELAGWMQNATAFYSAKPSHGSRHNTVQSGAHATLVSMTFEQAPATAGSTRPDLLVEDFEGDYRHWRKEGEAFGTQPVRRTEIPSYQGDVGGQGNGVANSHATAPGNSVEEKDAGRGRLLSAPFRLQRKFLSFFIGGGQRDDVGLRLWVDGQAVRTVTGHNHNLMRRETIDIAEFEGREAVLELFDDAQGGWANIGLDHVVQTDTPKDDVPLGQKPDFGTLALAGISQQGNVTANPSVAASALPGSAFEPGTGATLASGSAPLGAVTTRFTLAAGQSAEARFVLAWHFPNTTLPVADARSGNGYAARFSDAAEVVRYLAAELPRLESTTRLWRDTWADSTLPHWFLERTFVNASTLATTTAHRFGTGRFWGWEGIGCCQGTCTHVWHYAQAVGRLFPEIERDQRERIDFGLGFNEEAGFVRHRGEGTGPAIDGHCGRILGVWREHQMSADDAFLRRLWPRIQRAAEYVLRHDADGDGILDGAQENTLDAAWYGQIAWITSLTLAALRAVEEMAKELGDATLAARCHAQYVRGRASVETGLFNGEYFIQIPDPNREKSLGTYEACHIDQVHGQSWAWQVGLGRVLDREKTLSALRSLWRYNFAPDVGPFRRKFTAGRPYALAGDAGLVMTSNPRLLPNVYGLPSWQIGYFNECMSGFEHQVASHMVAEGMVVEGFAVTRAIHDRYHASRRNPFNEIECSDHYARAMASYGTFVSACGFECHGPSGRLGFAPRLTPEHFRAPFTAAGGWGTYEQHRDAASQSHRVEVKFGQVRIRILAVELAPGAEVDHILISCGTDRSVTRITQTGTRLEVKLEPALQVTPQTPLEMTVMIRS